MKRRILFVDDEPRIPEGLRRRLRHHRSTWETFFVESAKAALEGLASQPMDVIVSDVRIPQMECAALLKRVQDEYPHVVRIVLSGDAELEAALRAVPVAHQFLNKPCDVGVIENAIERACNLQEMINGDKVQNIVGRIGKLPPLPGMYSQLMVALRDEKASVQEVARILKQDMAMCAKLLQLVNSSFFRLSGSVIEIEKAIIYLGFDTIKRMALAVEVFGQASTCPVPAGLSLEALQTHALVAGSVAARLFTPKQQKEDAFIAGLLHDVGKLILAMELPGHVKMVMDTMRTEGGPMYAAEERLFGVTHAELGGYMLGRWGLPYPIVEAVANHHAPSRVKQHGFELLAAVHVADALVNEQLPTELRPSGSGAVSLDLPFLERLGVADKVEEWRDLARRQAEGLSPGLSTATRG